MSLKIYTKSGDKGKTSLLGGKKIFKSDIRIEAFGTIDELNSYIGLVIDYLKDDIIINELKEIQDRLFTIGSSLATDMKSGLKQKLPDLLETDILYLEKHIDKMQNILPVMKHFILPGGHVLVSTIHIARCVCRRAERCCVAIQQNNEIVDPIILKYLNRLSDYLFMLARYTAHLLKVSEVIWKPRMMNINNS